MLIPSLAELAAILIILLTYQLYNLHGYLLKWYQNKITKHSLHNCIIINYHLHYSIILTLTPTMNSSQDGTRRVGNFSTSFTGIPHQTLLDYYCTCITRKLGMPLETLQQTTCQNTTTTQIFRSASISPNPTIVNTSTRIIQHPGHLPLWWNNYNICHKITAIQPTTDTHPLKKKFTTFSWRCPQLAYWNIHH